MTPAELAELETHWTVAMVKLEYLAAQFLAMRQLAGGQYNETCALLAEVSEILERAKSAAQ